MISDKTNQYVFLVSSLQMISPVSSEGKWSFPQRVSVHVTEDYYYYWYSALGPVWAETRAQSGDWYGSGTLHPGQVLRGSLPSLSPAF